MIKVLKEHTAGLSAGEVFDRIVEAIGCPRMIVSDNGTKFTSNTILA